MQLNTESLRRMFVTTFEQLCRRSRFRSCSSLFIDGFCGGGSYECEDSTEITDGSPLLMLRAVREARALLNFGRDKARELSVDYKFIDIEPETVAHLKYHINARAEESLIDASDLSRIQVCQADFLSQLPNVLAEVKQRKMGERAIFVLDQYSYDKLPMPQIAGILSTINAGEVILTFNVGSLMTFMSDRAANRRPMEKIGLDRHIPWDQIATLKATQSQQWRQVLQRHLAYGIRQEAGARYATLFFVKPLGSNSWDYWLIHLSNHYKAHEVMKDLHWDNATEFGHELEPGVFMQGYDANRDRSYTGQHDFDFGSASRDLCIDGIREHFGQTLVGLHQPVKLGDLIHDCVSQSPGSTSHFMEAASSLHRSRDVVVCSADGKVRQPSKNYKMDDIIEHSRRIRLFT